MTDKRGIFYLLMHHSSNALDSEDLTKQKLRARNSMHSHMDGRNSST